MLTRTVDRILIDHFKISKTALLIEGARQIGKTFSIRQFGKNSKPTLKSILSNNLKQFLCSKI